MTTLEVIALIAAIVGSTALGTWRVQEHIHKAIQSVSKASGALAAAAAKEAKADLLEHEDREREWKDEIRRDIRELYELTRNGQRKG
jgi:hypothetical protein